jgi:hypothetical protein
LGTPAATSAARRAVANAAAARACPAAAADFTASNHAICSTKAP